MQEKNMSLHNNIKFLDEAGVEVLVSDLKRYNELCDVPIKSDINNLYTKIDLETSRAFNAESELESKLYEESERAKNAEIDLESKLNKERNDRSAEDSSLSLAIANEEINRLKQINEVKSQIEQNVQGVFTSLNSQIIEINNLTKDSLTSDIEAERLNRIDADNEEKYNREAADKALADDIEKESQISYNYYVSTQNDLDRARQTIQSVSDKTLANESIIKSHINRIDNPHNVTKEQLGLSNVDNTSDENKPLSNIAKEKFNNIDENLTNLNSVSQDLQENTVKKSGVENQTINGNITISGNTYIDGNTTVKGDLIVKGKTISKNHETLTVENNFLILNNVVDGDVAAIESGIAIRTDKDNSSYGIVYSPSQNAILLGEGAINGDDFSFSEGEGNPILTRASDDTFTQGNLLVWDADKKRAVDGGPVPNVKEFDPTEINTNIKEISSQIEDLTLSDQLQKDQIDQLSKIAEGKVDTTPVDENGYPSLKTNVKTVPEAINELYDNNIITNSDINSHILDRDNPHKVTIKQVIGEPNTAFNRNFAEFMPKMDGESTPGEESDNTVSRGSHTHPTDITRAPVDHSSVTVMYGKATTDKYGHVIVDAEISNSSENPVQNKVIAEKLDGKLDKLTIQNSAGVYGVSYGGQQQIMFPLNSDNAAWTVMYRNGDGKSSVNDPTPGTVEIANARYVDNKATTLQTNIDKKLSSSSNTSIVYSNNSTGKASTIPYTSKAIKDTLPIRDSYNNFEVDEIPDSVTISNNSDKYVANLGYVKSKINNEAITRANADEALSLKIDGVQTSLQSDLNNKYQELNTKQSKIDNFRNSWESFVNGLTEQNYYQNYCLSFNLNADGTYTPIFTTMDDGVL